MQEPTKKKNLNNLLLFAKKKTNKQQQQNLQTKKALMLIISDPSGENVSRLCCQQGKRKGNSTGTVLQPSTFQSSS